MCKVPMQTYLYEHRRAKIFYYERTNVDYYFFCASSNIALVNIKIFTK